MKRQILALASLTCWLAASVLDCGRATGEATDPFHVDWVAFCKTHASNCDAGGNPHYAAGDADMVANTLPASPYDAGITHACESTYVVPGNFRCGFVVGVYDASANDPLVRIHLTMYKSGRNPAGDGPLDGSSIRIPRNAIPEPGADGHLDIRQPGGVMCELWRTNRTNPPTAKPEPVDGPDLYAASGGCGGDYGGAYATSIETTPGMIRAQDLAGGNGDGTDAIHPYSFTHAVYGSFANNADGHVWPALKADGQCATKAHHGAEPVEGMYLYLDTAGYHIVERWAAPVYLRPLQRFLGNLHVHGMIDLDSSGCGDEHHYVNTLTYGPQAEYAKSGTSLMDTYLRGWIAPNDAHFIGTGGGSDQAIYRSGPGQYEFRMLQYRDVPGLSMANFHWLGYGCGRLAAQGTSDRPC